MRMRLDYQLNWNDRFDSGEPVRSYRFDYRACRPRRPMILCPLLAQASDRPMNDRRACAGDAATGTAASQARSL